MIFAHKEYLFLLLLLVPYIIWYVLKQRKSEPTLQVDTTTMYDALPKSYKCYLLHLPFALRMATLALLILILARPQTTNNWQNTEIEGIDIMITLDISGTMQAEDLKPNRLEAAKEAAAAFINGRPNDNIGLVVYSAESFTQCPLTTDHAALLNLISEVKYGMVADGTAIGVALATAVSRLKDSQAKSKVVILLTDGLNNRGDISPLTAAEIAKTFGIRVYTIGVGGKGNAPFPMQTAFGTQYVQMPVEIDEAMLTEMAAMTNGNYFRATDKKTLTAIYEEIDQLEKTKLSVKEFSKRKEEYQFLVWIAVATLLLELLLRNTILKRIP